MIWQPEPAIPPASTLKVKVRMSPSSSVMVGSLTARKHQRAPDVTTPPSINLTWVKRSTRSSKAAQPAPPAIDEKPTKTKHGTLITEVAFSLYIGSYQVVLNASVLVYAWNHITNTAMYIMLEHLSSANVFPFFLFDHHPIVSLI
ncbi:hypothetical protein IW261DRAFT_1569698 [Armillaria novae-zelandiae]|uniref:Uncharacterized protein n=1 Tax=Armillaria novae-zelandiae TaxID=153914 RepID=A0AA39NXD3_9AGAR|nr:hypothetical protein IW261DRAFT_1569698 [Armillaria novae-zelandiae]